MINTLENRFIRSISKSARRFPLIIFVYGFCALASGSDLSLNGSTIYEDLGKQQFVAALFVDTINSNANSLQLQQSPKRMEVRLLNNYSKRRWLNLWMQSISINNDRDSFSGSAQEVIDIMQAPKSAPKKGDIIEYLFDPKEGTSVRFNGTELISNYPADVFNVLLRTWIGPIPPSTAFKDELLGNSINFQAQELLHEIEPQPNRVALAASWIKTPAPVEPDPIPVVAEIKTAPEAEPKPAVEETVAAEPEETQKPAETEQVASNNESSEENAEGSDATEANKETDTEETVDFDVVQALAQRDYTPLVVAQIFKAIVYPNRAAEKNQQGTVRIALTIDRSGELLEAVTTQESKHRMLNQAALKAAKKLRLSRNYQNP
jgi:TonB family protein